MPWASSARQIASQQPRTGPEASPIPQGQENTPSPAPSPPRPPLTHTVNNLPRSTRANPFPKVTGPICRLPLPALFISSRGCSPWGPDADIGTPRRGFLNSKELKADRFSRAVNGELDAGKAPALCPCKRVSPHKRIPHSPHTRSNRKDNSAQRRRQRVRLISRHRSPHPCAGISTRFPFATHKKVHSAIATQLRNDSPMPNQCSHGTLPRFALQGSRLNTCYYHQDLH